MIDTRDGDKATIKLNGTTVWNWDFGSGPEVRLFQEVIGSGVVKSGKNTFRVSRSTKVSDVVLWWQADIERLEQNGVSYQEERDPDPVLFESLIPEK